MSTGLKDPRPPTAAERDECEHLFRMARMMDWPRPSRPEQDSHGPRSWTAFWRAKRYEAEHPGTGRPVPPHIPGVVGPLDDAVLAARMDRNRARWERWPWPSEDGENPELRLGPGELRCPPEFETATGVFDPAGYDENVCAGCGMAKQQHEFQTPIIEGAHPKGPSERWRLEHPTITSEEGEQYEGAAWILCGPKDGVECRFTDDCEVEAREVCAALNRIVRGTSSDGGPALGLGPSERPKHSICWIDDEIVGVNRCGDTPVDFSVTIYEDMATECPICGESLVLRQRNWIESLPGDAVDVPAPPAEPERCHFTIGGDSPWRCEKPAGHDGDHVCPFDPNWSSPPAEPTWVDMQTRSDCVLACYSSLTGLPMSEMPQPPTSYEELTSGGEPTDADRAAEAQYAQALVLWLREHGWLLVRLWGTTPPVGYSIASGPSPRNRRIWHSVVHRDGKLVHDPHPSRAGIETVEEYEILVRTATDRTP